MVRACRNRGAFLIFCGWLLTVLANGAFAQGRDGPALLLVAAPALQGVYGRSVIMAIPVGNEQYVGFIINKPSRRTLASAFPELPAAKKAIDPIYVGGPEALGTVFALVRASDLSTDAIRLFDDLFLVAATAAIIRNIERIPTRARFVSGYIIWSTGELEAEVERGAWHLLKPAAEMVFRTDPATLWPQLIERVFLKDASSNGAFVQHRRRPSASPRYSNGAADTGREFL